MGAPTEFFLNLCTWKPGCSPVGTLLPFHKNWILKYDARTKSNSASCKRCKIDLCTCPHTINWNILWKRSSSSTHLDFLRQYCPLLHWNSELAGGVMQECLYLWQLLNIFSNQSRLSLEIFPKPPLDRTI